MDLTSKQRAQLRGLANGIGTIIQIGKDGIGENLIKQTDSALEARLAKATRSEVVQVIGTKFILYRESHSKPKDKRIALVRPAPRKKAP